MPRWRSSFLLSLQLGNQGCGVSCENPSTATMARSGSPPGTPLGAALGTAHHPTSHPSLLRLWSPLCLEGSRGAPPPRPGKPSQRGAGREPRILPAIGAVKRPSARGREGRRGPAGEGREAAARRRAARGTGRSAHRARGRKRRAQPGGRGRAREGFANPGASLTWSREVRATEEEETAAARGRESS